MLARVIKLLVVTSLAGGVAVAAYLYVSEPQPVRAQSIVPVAKPAVVVEVSPVRVGSVTDSVQAIGSLLPNESAIISPELGGRIVRIEFDEGEPVRRGQALIALDDDIYQAEVAQARASLDLSRTNYERAEELLRRGAGSVTARDEALAQQRVNEAQLALAEARLDKRTISAPFDGVVGLRAISVGDYVEPGRALVTLVDADPIKVDFRVPERFLPSVHSGQKVEVELDAYPGEAFEGIVYAIAPEIDVNGRSLRLRARIPNRDGRLKPGQFARVALVTELRDNALLVPEEALVPRGVRRYVFRVVNGRAVSTEVKIGRRVGGEVEIVAGLSAGDRVVSAGQLKLSDGIAIESVAGRGS